MNRDEEKCLEIMQKIPTYKRIQASFDLYDFAKERITAELYRQNPHISASKLKDLVRERFVD